MERKGLRWEEEAKERQPVVFEVSCLQFYFLERRFTLGKTCLEHCGERQP